MTVVIATFPSYQASETITDQQISKELADSFNGTVIVSQATEDGYDVYYSNAAGTNGGYSADTIYDVGSISKIYTTVGILLLQEEGLLNLTDPINMYLDNVPSDKQGITIEMLLTHSSGIYVEENTDHSVTKEAELSRILTSDLGFSPGENYKYSNAGFTLLAAIIEDASGDSYENYLQSSIFDKLGLTTTGFPNSENLNSLPAVSGTLNDESYGVVTDFDYGWYSKGYSDVLTTPAELTLFFQGIFSGKLISEESISLLSTADIDIGSSTYRGIGTVIISPESEDKYIGHTGVWYGGNSAVFYRPADGALFVATADSVYLNYDYPAMSTLNNLFAAFPVNSLSQYTPISSEVITISEPTTELVFNADELDQTVNTIAKETGLFINDNIELSVIVVLLMLMLIICFILRKRIIKS